MQSIILGISWSKIKIIFLKIKNVLFNTKNKKKFQEFSSKNFRNFKSVFEAVFEFFNY